GAPGSATGGITTTSGAGGWRRSMAAPAGFSTSSVSALAHDALLAETLPVATTPFTGSDASSEPDGTARVGAVTSAAMACAIAASGESSVDAGAGVTVLVSIVGRRVGAPATASLVS